MTDQVSQIKVELASKDLRITGLEEILRQTLEQLNKVHSFEMAECQRLCYRMTDAQFERHQVIARAERMLEKRMPVECEYPKCKCPRFGHCGKAGLYYDRA